MPGLRSIASAVVATAALAVPAAAAVPTANAAGTVRSALSLGAPASGVYGSNITLRGRLWRYGTPNGIGSAVVWLQRAPHGRAAWSNIKSGRTAGNGTYAFAVTQSGAYDYRVYYAGSATYRAALSPTRYPVTSQRMSFESIATVNASTGALQTVGYVYPLPPNGVTVYLQRWDPEARVWHNIGTGRTSGGKATVTVTRPGSVNAYRMVVPARSPYGAGISAAKWFAHYVWRGGFVRGVVYVSDSGTMSMPKPADNPQRDRISHYTGPTSRFEFGIDASGCRQVATSSKWGWAGGALNLQMYNTTKVIDTDTLYPDSTVAMSGAHDPADPRIYFYTANPNSGGAQVTTTIRLLCTN